jgi:peptide/nickel transport system permease protein
MIAYLAKRLSSTIMTLAIISVVSYLLIELPPGDYLTFYITQLTSQGSIVSEAEIASLEKRFGLDQPISVRYLKWISGVIFRGDFGISFTYNTPVWSLVRERFLLSAAVAFASAVLLYVIAVPIGIYAAVKQYSFGDYALTFLGFVGLSIPDFLLALVFLYVGIKYFNANVGGLFSPKYELAPWSVGKVLDLLSNLWIPVLIIGMSSTAGMIRALRATMLDELHQPYVATARAKGLSERVLTLKYPARVAISPFISTVGWTIPSLVSGTTITSIVLSLPTLGPMLFDALIGQDMYLAGSIVLLISTMTVAGTLVSDLLLAWADPRIRYED